MKNIIVVVCLFVTSYGYSQNDGLQNNFIKEIRIIDEIKADFEKDGKIDKALIYKGIINDSKIDLVDTIQFIKIEFANKKVLETKPMKLEFGKLKLNFNEKSNELTIILSPEDEDGTIAGRFSASKIIVLKYNKKVSNFIAIKMESNSMNLIIETDLIKKIRKYYDADDGFNTLINDGNGNDIWLKKINFKESIIDKKIIFTDIDLNTFNLSSEFSKGFNEYVKKEIKNPANKN